MRFWAFSPSIRESFVWCLFCPWHLPKQFPVHLFTSEAQWPKSRDTTAMCDAIRIAHPKTLAMWKSFFRLAMRKHISLIWNHRKMPEEPSAKIQRCWTAMQKIGMLFKIGHVAITTFADVLSPIPYASPGPTLKTLSSLIKEIKEILTN